VPHGLNVPRSRWSDILDTGQTNYVFQQSITYNSPPVDFYSPLITGLGPLTSSPDLPGNLYLDLQSD
jgi:hypothetical protein